MYATTAKSSHFRPRTGSYSTHGRANGRVDVLPPGAVEAIYGDVQQRRLDLIAKVAVAVAAKDAANKAWKALIHGSEAASYNNWVRSNCASMNAGTGPVPKPEKLAGLNEQRRAIRKEAIVLQAQLDKLNQTAHPRVFAKMVYQQIFLILAKQMLDTNAFTRIEAAAKDAFTAAQSEQHIK
jgi:hypothetical protein